MANTGIVVVLALLLVFIVALSGCISTPVCGDNICSSSEDSVSCPADCSTTGTVPVTTTPSGQILTKAAALLPFIVSNLCSSSVLNGTESAGYCWSCKEGLGQEEVSGISTVDVLNNEVLGKFAYENYSPCGGGTSAQTLCSRVLGPDRCDQSSGQRYAGTFNSKFEPVCSNDRAAMRSVACDAGKVCIEGKSAQALLSAQGGTYSYTYSPYYSNCYSVSCVEGGTSAPDSVVIYANINGKQVAIASAPKTTSTCKTGTDGYPIIGTK